MTVPREHHWYLVGARKSAIENLTMRIRELEWEVSCASIVPLQREESKGTMEDDGGSSYAIHVQTPKIRPHLGALTPSRAMLRIMVTKRIVLAISIPYSTF